MTFVLQDFSAIPNKAWVYLFYWVKDDILYIGKAKNLKNRVKQYFAPWSVWKQEMLEKAIKLDFMLVTTESEALYLEDNLIKKHKPVYNSLLKADNSYVYIKITKWPFPLLFVTRIRKNDGSIYLGPKRYTRELTKLLHYLRQVFHYRTCTPTIFAKGKLCGDYHFGMCEWWCVYEKWYKNLEEKKSSKILPIENVSFAAQYTYDEAILKNKKMVRLLVDFFSGKTSSIENQLLDEIKIAVDQERFEYAATLRDVFHGIKLFTEKQHVVLDTNITWQIMKVRTMEWWYVLSVANIFEGKIIDVLRFKYHTSDTQIEDLISDFSSEYGSCLISQPNGKFLEISNGMSEIGKSFLCISTSLKKTSKKILGEIEILLDRFIDGYIASSTFQKENIMSDLLGWLQARYAFPRFPYIIECADISHLSGGRTSWAVVSMKEWLLNKKWYRRFKIWKWVEGTNDWIQQAQPITASDDYAALRDVIRRRFSWVDLSTSYIPDVFVLDGWKGQLDIIKQLYQEEERFVSVFERIHFCALGKWSARKRSAKSAWEKECVYWFENNWTIIQKEIEYDDVDRLLLLVRDEAHRFSNAYRKKQMSMEFTNKKTLKK